jgi:hypothetical protein
MATSPNQARPPVKRALMQPPPPPPTATLSHVHSTHTSNEVQFTMPGSRSEPGASASVPSAVLAWPPGWACMPLDLLDQLICISPPQFFSLLMPKAEVAHINTNAVPQPFLDPALLQKENDNSKGD